jgi:glycosidase
MNQLKAFLQELYSPEEREQAYEAITQLMDHYRSLLPQGRGPLTEKDVLLICYGDQVQRKGEAPLISLKRLLDEVLSPEINGLHILPFYPYTSDDGFSVQDYKAVDPALGSWEDIQALSQDYRLMFDAVINHISQASDWFQGFLGNDPRYEGFFLSVDPQADLSAVVRPRALPLLTPFQKADGSLHHIWTTFSEDQIDLNYGNWRVLVAVLDVLLWYLSQGAHLLRLDAIGFMWKVIGNSSIHLPQTHTLIKLMRWVTECLAPEALLITETNVPHAENISYFGDGKDEAHLVYNFSLPPLVAHAVLSGEAHYLASWAQSLALPSQEVCFFNFLASHDGVGVRPVEGILPQEEIDFLVAKALAHGGEVSYRAMPDGSEKPYELNCSYLNLLTPSEATVDEKARRMLLAQAVMLAMPGLPGIYFHSLLGSENDREGMARTGRKRSINREKLEDSRLRAELQEVGSLRQRVFSLYQAMLRARQAESAFHPHGEFAFEMPHPAVLEIRRIAPGGGERLFAFHNFSDQPVSLSLPEGRIVFAFPENPPPDQLLPYQILWVK